VEALKSDNYGVRKSALYQLAKIHSLDSTIDMTTISEQISKMSRSDSDPLVRVQAGLTYQYLTDAELAKIIRPQDEDDSTVFYNEVHTVLAGRW
jgi:vesicle coat complex subunit